MRIVGLDGREYKLSFTENQIFEDDITKKSAPHLRCRALLKELYPFEIAYEEVHFPGAKTNLFVDFFFTRKRLAIEVQGQQHFEEVAMFHGADGFKRQKQRDGAKRRLLELNKIKLVELHHGKSDDDWREELRRA